MLRISATHCYSADGLGSITSLTDGSGAVATSYAYDAFGNLAASTGSLTNSFRFTAREFDTETGLYFYRARYYDSSGGRFLSEDPLRFEADSVNFYEYSYDNPANFVDPSGMQPVVVPAPVPAPQTVPGLFPKVFPGWFPLMQPADELSTDPWGRLYYPDPFTPSGGPLPPLAPRPPDVPHDFVQSLNSSEQRQREYEIAKNFCNSVVSAGSDPCSNLSKMIDHALRCIALYEAWDAKWNPGRHADTIRNWKRRARNLKDKHRRDCTSKC